MVENSGDHMGRPYELVASRSRYGSFNGPFVRANTAMLEVSGIYS
jgi:hypothetical protein